MEPFPGGQYLEYAEVHGHLDRYLPACVEAGYRWVEVSDNIAPVSLSWKEGIIARAVEEFGLKVLGEVGKKEGLANAVSADRRREGVHGGGGQPASGGGGGADPRRTRGPRPTSTGSSPAVGLEKVMFELPGPWISGVEEHHVHAMRRDLIDRFGTPGQHRQRGPRRPALPGGLPPRPRHQRRRARVTAMGPAPLKAVLFDFDYTLADSSVGVIDCVRHAQRRMGLDLSGEEEIRRTIGLSVPDIVAALNGEAERPRSEEFGRLFLERADRVMAAGTVVYDAVPGVLEDLHARGVVCGIASTKYRYRIEGILDREGLRHLVGAVVGAEDVTEHKPDPGLPAPGSPPPRGRRRRLPLRGGQSPRRRGGAPRRDPLHRRPQRHHAGAGLRPLRASRPARRRRATAGLAPRNSG